MSSAGSAPRDHCCSRAVLADADVADSTCWIARPRSGVLLLTVSMFTLALLLPAASAQQRQVELLRAADAAQLKEVFFSGEPWLVQCGTKAEISAAIVDDGFGAHAVVEKAASALPKDVKVGLLDCHKQLPSGKTTLERFKLDG